MNSLEINGIAVVRSGREILSGVSFDVTTNSTVAVVGPNGSGKSTLLRCMAGLWPVTGGAVTLNQTPLPSMHRTELARAITYVPQETRLDFSFTVRDVVLMGRYAHRGRFERSKRDDVDAADEAMGRADVTHLADRLVTNLSGGERQRVLIARGLATRASILLLDEPTANLDVDHALDILELMRTLAREGHAIVVATHDLNAVYRVADRVALLDSGRLVAIGSPDDVLTPQNLDRAFHVRAETLIGTEGIPVLLFHRLEISSGVHCR